MIGTLLNNRYRIDAQVGEGGMGVVYRAYDSLLQRPVAIKTLSPALLGDEGMRRFLREAQSAAKLTHSNIVSIFDVVDEAGSFAIVMELVEGKTLRELLPLPFDRLIEYGSHVLRALDYAHSQGIVHRDIKPENIIVTTEGVAKIMDFGLARSEGRSRLTQTGLLVGTVAYLAPEQALGGEVDGRSDLYSLGAVFYECVTGHPPFEADDPIATITQHINVPPVAPRFHNPAVPPALEAIIIKLLAKDPAHRFRSAREVLTALQTISGTLTLKPEPEAKTAGPDLIQAVRRGVLVGRDEETRTLKRLLDEAAGGDGRLVLVAGQAGVGKTRLVDELITYAHLRGTRVLLSRCYERTTPYEPVVRMIHDHLRLSSAEEVREALGDYATDLARLAPEIRQKLGALPEAIPLPPEQERTRLFEAVSRLFVAVSRTEPALLIVDDLHLADSSTLQLLRYLAPAVAGQRLMLIAAHQSEEAERATSLAELLRWLRRERYVVPIEVKPLTADQVGELIKAMANHPTVPTRFAARIYEVTEGNPYYIEEVINGLFERGTLYIKDGQWSTDFDEGARYAEMPVPATIRSTIEARLERLDEPVRQALTQAAVLGRQFPLDALAQMTGQSEDTLLDLLDQALEARLLREVRVDGEDRFEFIQSMVREVIYEGLSRHRRRRMHSRAAEVLEQAYGTNLKPRAGEIADHYLEAGEEERAIPYLTMAGEHAAALFAAAEAIKRYEAARELMEDAGKTEEAIRLLEALGEPYLHTGQPQKAIECYQRALEYFAVQHIRAKVAELRRMIGHVHQMNWDFAAAIPVLEQALQEFGEKTGRDVLMLYLDLARAHNLTGNVERALEWALRALEQAKASGAADESALAHSEVAFALQSSMQVNEAEPFYRQAIKLAQGSNTYTGRFTVQRSINNIGSLQSTRGDFKAELQARRQALEMAEEVGDPSWIAFQLLGVAFPLWRLGEWELARVSLNKLAALGERGGGEVRVAPIHFKFLDEDWQGALEGLRALLVDAETRGNAQSIVVNSMRMAEASLMLQRYNDAEKYARRGAESTYPAPFWTWPDVHILLAESLARQGRIDEAARACDEAEQTARAIGGTGVFGGIHFVRGLIAGAAGRREEAVQHFEEGIRIYDEFPQPYAQARVFEALGELHRGSDPGKAVQTYQQGLAIFERLEAKRSADRVKEILARLG